MSKLTAVNQSNLIALEQKRNEQEYSALVEDWLGLTHSFHTLRTYTGDLTDFFRTMYQEQEINPDTVGRFLSLNGGEAFIFAERYHKRLIERGLAPATINRKLAVVKSFVSFAGRAGKCNYQLAGLKREQAKVYRDTTGIAPEQFLSVLATIDNSKEKGIRDKAILLLLWCNALRRSELVGINIGDYNPQQGLVAISGKGRANQKELITLGQNTIVALNEWLLHRRESNPSCPLFTSIQPRFWGGRLTTNAVYLLVRKYCKLAGINKQMSPHRIRHSSITAALDATDGNVRRVQKLSRHSNLNTLIIYDDNRQNAQGEVTALLDGMV